VIVLLNAVLIAVAMIPSHGRAKMPIPGRPALG
jgi:hypothetical protein